MKTMKIADIEPGCVFVADWGVDRNPQFYLKVNEHKLVNLTSYMVCTPKDQQEEVKVMPYKLGIYLWNGGLRKPPT